MADHPQGEPADGHLAEFRKQLLEERDAARGDPRLKARFLSYRLNVPTADESEVLLTVEDFNLAVAREVAPATGQPIVGVDLGQNRSWTAAVAIWETGRIEAMAIAPGIPDLAEQEKRDTVPRGTYQTLYDLGMLDVADGLRVPEPDSSLGGYQSPLGYPCGNSLRPVSIRQPPGCRARGMPTRV